VFITHDQEEALVLSDRIAVMDGGSIRQIDRPGEIYDRPVDDFVAAFIGESNLLAGRVSGPDTVELDAGFTVTARGARAGDVRLLIRPERIVLGEAPNRFTGEVVEAVYLGASHKLRVRVNDRLELLLRGNRAVEPGSRVTLGFAPEDVHVIGGAG